MQPLILALELDLHLIRLHGQILLDQIHLLLGYYLDVTLSAGLD